MATLALRWPQGRSISHGRSNCDGCGRALTARDLIPILSFVVLRGRCRTCGATIARTHILIEFTAAVIGAVAFLIAPNIGGAACALLGWQLLLLGWLDARHWWLPHALSALLAASGLTLGGVAMAAIGLEITLVDRCIGMAGGFTALAIIALGYRALRGREGLGGGDAPMLGAIGAWVGWAALPLIMLLAALVGIAIALITLMRRSQDKDGLPIGQMRLPLGTLMAMATPFALLLMYIIVLVPKP